LQAGKRLFAQVQCGCPLLRSRRRRLRQRFLVAPHRQRKGAAWYFEMFGHDSSAEPAALFVKPGGTVVSNRTSKPRCAHAAFSQMCFCIGNQRSGDTGPSRPGGHIELVELGALYHTKADWLIVRSGDPHTRQKASKPCSETLERTHSSELDRQDSCMCVLPALIPDRRQPPDFSCAGIPDVRVYRGGHASSQISAQIYRSSEFRFLGSHPRRRRAPWSSTTRSPCGPGGRARRTAPSGMANAAPPRWARGRSASPSRARPALLPPPRAAPRPPH
jgi:hypothetical protein